MGKKSTKHINDIMNSHVAKHVNTQAANETKELLELGKSQIYIEDDASIANPYSLLGRVLVESGFGQDKEYHFHTFPIPIEVDEKSKLRQPLKTKSFVVDKKLSSGIRFLNFLNSQLDTESLFSVIVFTQAVGLVDDRKASYQPSIIEWIRANQQYEGYQDSNHLIVTGFVQKNIIRKKYKKFDIKNKGGAYGINFNGNLYTSTEDYSLDIRFGLTLRTLPKFPDTKTLSSAFENIELEEYVADNEINIKVSA